jgi:hypothetical protein
MNLSIAMGVGAALICFTSPHEKPLHSVTISKPFAVGKF